MTIWSTIWHLMELLWGPVVEITVLTVTIYYLISFLRRTRGWAVTLGWLGFMALIMTLIIITGLLNLNVLTRVFYMFLVVLPLAALVIFQPELRRLLAELGNQPLFQTTHEERENIEIIIQTVERLAEVRIGALIAIEQATQLKDAVESGIPVGCEATPEMLETIFFPNNAIHDGGVIIKGDRIAYAACIFPLTQRQDLGVTLGTRHRAAIGLSEETDAIVVAVSEETGAVSYAYRGQLVRKVASEELRAFLSSILVRRAAPRNWSAWIRSRLLNPVRPGPVVVSKTDSAPARAQGE